MSQALALYQSVIFPQCGLPNPPCACPTPGSAAAAPGTNTAAAPAARARLLGLHVTVLDPVARPPQPAENETYVLDIPDPSSGDGVATLQAATYMGLLRGLETFSQILRISIVVRGYVNVRGTIAWI